jgi:putative salt-induced outer membrane protein
MQPEKIRRALCVLALAAVALPASAQWTGKGEAGIALASGNSDSKTANAKIAVGRKLDAWEHTASLAGLYVRNDGATSAKRWEVGAQSRRTFMDRNFWYGGLRYEEDRFSGFDHQGSVTTGVGRKFIDNDTTKLSGQIGAGYKFSRTVDTLTALADKGSNLVGVANVDFEHRLNASTKVFDRFGSEIVSGNKFLQNDIGVAVKVSDRMALALAYAVRHNTDPPAGFRKTDTLSTINLVYEVK